MNRQDCSACLCTICDRLRDCPVSEKHRNPITPDPCIGCLRFNVYELFRNKCPEYRERKKSLKPQLAVAIKAALSEMVDHILLPEPEQLDCIQVYIRTNSSAIRFELDAQNIIWRMEQ